MRYLRLLAATVCLFVPFFGKAVVAALYPSESKAVLAFIRRLKFVGAPLRAWNRRRAVQNVGYGRREWQRLVAEHERQAWLDRV